MTKKGEYVVTDHPAVEATVLTVLHSSSMRSTELVKFVESKHNLSAPSVYAILKKLEETGLIEKTKKSSRNVQYRIATKGKEVLEEEYLKAKETLVFAVRSSPNRDEIVAEVLVAELLEKLPQEWKDSRKRERLIDALMTNIEAIIGSTIKLLESS